MRYFFARLDEKHKLLGNIEKIVKFFMKIYRKIPYFYFYFFGKFVPKNRAFGNNTNFSTTIFSVSGGGWENFPPFPLATPLIHREPTKQAI